MHREKAGVFLVIIIVDPVNFENAASNSIINVRLNSGPTRIGEAKNSLEF